MSEVHQSIRDTYKSMSSLFHHCLRNTLQSYATTDCKDHSLDKEEASILQQYAKTSV